jgi:hypothetical protein
MGRFLKVSTLKDRTSHAMPHIVDFPRYSGQHDDTKVRLHDLNESERLELLSKLLRRMEFHVSVMSESLSITTGQEAISTQENDMAQALQT